MKTGIIATVKAVFRTYCVINALLVAETLWASPCGILRLLETPANIATYLFTYDFTQRHLRSISKAADIITDLTDEEDALIFLGRTPLYIAESLESKGVERQTYRIAFSMKGLMSPHSIEADAFRRYLEDSGLTPETIANISGKIYIVDTVEYGNTIRDFAGILKDWAVEKGHSVQSVTEKLEVIRLIFGSPLADIGERGVLRKSGLAFVELRMHKGTLRRLSVMPRELTLGPHYPPDQWYWPPPRFNPSEGALDLRRQVREYR